MTKRVSTKSLVENSAFKDRGDQIGPFFHSRLLRSGIDAARAKGNIRKDSKERIYEAVEDVCQFYRYGEQISQLAFEITLPRTIGNEAYFGRRISDMKVLTEQLYGKMKGISEKYPQNNSLKNKLDEAERACPNLFNKLRAGKYK